MTYHLSGYQGLWDSTAMCKQFNADIQKYGRPAYTHEGACGELLLKVFASWWFEKLWAHNLEGKNFTGQVKYCAEPAPKDCFSPWYEVPAIPGVVQQMSKGTAKSIVETLMDTLIQDEKKREYPRPESYPMWNLTKMAPDLLRNWDDSYACAEDYTKTVAQYKSMTALPTSEVPAGGEQATKTATGFCKPVLVFSLDSKRRLAPGCKVHPECKRTFYGNIEPVPAPAPSSIPITFALLKLATTQQEATPTLNLAMYARKASAEDAPPGADDKKMSGPMLAAGVLALGAVGLVGFVFLRKKR